MDDQKIGSKGKNFDILRKSWKMLFMDALANISQNIFAYFVSERPKHVFLDFQKKKKKMGLLAF